MKILLVSFCNVFPPYWGGASRIYNITKFLAKKNKVWLLCNDFRFLKDKEPQCIEYDEFKKNENIKIFFIKPSSSKSQIINFSLINQGLKIIKNEKPDFVLASHLYSTFSSMILSWFSHVPYFFDEHNVEFIRHSKLYKNRKIQNFFLKIFESVACKKAKNIFCVSENDRNLLITKLKIPENKINVIPNSVDIEKFYPSDKNSTKIRQKLKSNDAPLIVFFGKLDYKPNHDAVNIIKNEISPRVLKKISNARFVIVGDNPPNEFKVENIIFTGLVEKIEDYINVADLIICPLESGGGTRLKILESLACGKYVISTTLGSEGINLREFENALKIHDDWDSFSNEIIHCLGKKNLEKYNYDSISWKKSINDMSNVFENFKE